MAAYKPNTPFNVPLFLLVPAYEKIKGTPVKKYPEKGELIYCSYKTYGGTEAVVNGLYSVEDTAVIETWYRPDIKADCAFRLTDDNTIYEVVGKPEDINRQHQYLKFKVKAVTGGA